MFIRNDCVSLELQFMVWIWSAPVMTQFWKMTSKLWTRAALLLLGVGALVLVFSGQCHLFYKPENHQGGFLTISVFTTVVVFRIWATSYIIHVKVAYEREIQQNSNLSWICVVQVEPIAGAWTSGKQTSNAMAITGAYNGISQRQAPVSSIPFSKQNFFTSTVLCGERLVNLFRDHGSS